MPAIPLAVGAVLVVCGLAIVLLWPDGSDPLRIYSSLPQREQLPLEDDNIGVGGNPRVVPNERTTDMQNAMKLALAQAGHKAGDRDVTYQPLDDSDAIGESPAAVVQANARRAADDDNTAVYIGDFTSDATQQSIPILSLARIPQISVSSTRVGLTKKDPEGDVNEPGRYYPSQGGYKTKGYRNFVRLIPNAAVHAQALVALMGGTTARRSR